MVGYQGIPEPQMAMIEVIEGYAPSHSSVLEGTEISAPSSSAVPQLRELHRRYLPTLRRLRK